MKNCYEILFLIGVIVCTVTCDDTTSTDLVQPCGSSINLNCVRKYFSKNSKCDVVTHSDKKPVFEKYKPFFVPVVDLTVIPTGLYLSNMDGTIKKFYKDEKTGNLVMSVSYEGLSCSGSAFLVMSQKGKEPKVVLEQINATYPPVILTTVIPASKGITVTSLKKAQYSAHFLNNNAVISIGEKFTKSEDPVISATYNGLLQNIPTALKEIFLTKASYYFLSYLQNYICDFDGKPAIKKYDPTVASYINGIDTDKSEINDPCEDSDDITNCVRNFFDEQSVCTVVSQDPQEPIYRKMFANFVPSQSLTGLSHNLYISGLNGQISQFYINKDTGLLVMAVDFPNLYHNITSTDFFIFKSGEEPIVTSDYIRCGYNLTLTAVIPINKALTSESLKKAMISSSFAQSNKCDIGPRAKATKDQDMLSALKKLEEGSLTVGRENFVNGARNNFMIYLQEYICDFGIPVQLSLY